VTHGLKAVNPNKRKIMEKDNLTPKKDGWDGMPIDEPEVVKMNLTDNSEQVGSIPTTVKIINGTIEIYPEGYGDASTMDGHGCPIFIEYYEGELRVVTFPNINDEDAEIQNMEGAKEIKRK